MYVDPFIKEASELFPGIKTSAKGHAPQHIVARALYFRVQQEIAKQHWDEVARVFAYLTKYRRTEERAINWFVLEDFDYQGHEEKIRSLMGKPLVEMDRKRAANHVRWTTSEEEEETRRAQQRQFDQEVFQPKPSSTKKTPRIRKPVVELKPSDFKKFPVWEFASDEEAEGEQDETWVRPVKGVKVPRDAYSQLVATDFITASGKRFEGFMVVTTAKEEVLIDAGSAIVTDFYQPLPSLSSVNKSDADCRKLARILGLRVAELFPLKYKLRVLITGEKDKRSGVLN